MCSECRLCLRESWDGKLALRCGKPGKYYGRVTHVLPGTVDVKKVGAEAPKWCREVQREA